MEAKQKQSSRVIFFWTNLSECMQRQTKAKSDASRVIFLKICSDFAVQSDRNELS